ncbi:MAG TPA: SagB family peptide dehydrogenase [Rhodocyclaceae bacterium]|nr:SagB family peptide dehydrogenase [Rhodocyclaceae bacterium]
MPDLPVMPPLEAAPAEPPAAPITPADLVLAYHRRTRHRFDAYARGPSTLDWDAQPAPFRHFGGTRRIRLPLACAEACAAPPATPAAADLTALGTLLHLSFGITAWKRLGPDRWAVRANPSSGNLHPVEAYVLVAGLPDLEDGLYHYLPDVHALELRAAHPRPFAAGPALAVGLTSVMWREMWKYGERAFRYCQLDTGHALACLHYAAALLGWRVSDRPGLASAALARVLGTDRDEDFPGRRPDVSREEVELLACVGPADGLPVVTADALAEAADAARWQGVASEVDRHPMFRWPVVDEVAAASRRVSGVPVTPLPVAIPRPASAQHILQRRSAQRFDPAHVMPREDFVRLLDALRPVAGGRLGLALFIHRVDGLAPGVYLLARADWLRPQPTRAGASALQPVTGCPDLYCLSTSESVPLRRLARSLHCHQDIAANACIAFGLLAQLEREVADDPARYRDLLREAGFLGQVLYLEAEAMGLRGTGVGCYFDDPVHELVIAGQRDAHSLYHFTIGLPVDDGRIETGPAYPATLEMPS